MTATTSTPQLSDEKRLLLRQAFGNFATGVTVVTTLTASGEPIGFTANSFTSVSLDPPLLLVCLAKISSNLESFATTDAFAVNILEENQKDVSGRFASPVRDRFADTDWRSAKSGVPLIKGSVGWFDCNRHELIDAGDHVILIGHIQEFGQSDQRRLAYLRGRYLEIGLGETAAEAISHTAGVRVGCVLDCMGHVLLQSTPEGWVLPMGKSQAGLKNGRASLEAHLASIGVSAEVGFLYSVFDGPSGNATWLIFHGEIDAGKVPEGMKLFPIADIPIDEIPFTQVQSLLRRYQVESADTRFGLYVDNSTKSGSVTPIQGQSKNWNKFLKEQEVKQ